MRLPVLASFILHLVMIAAALRLPVDSRLKGPRSIEIEVRSPPKPAPPVLPPEPPPLEEAAPVEPAPRPRLASRERDRRRPEELTEPPPAEATPSPPTEPQPQPPPSDRPRSGPIDLKLHALPSVPGGSDSGALILPSTPAAPAGTLPGGRRPWHPRGDAGDPITGKIREVPVDPYPLKAIGGGELLYNGPSFKARVAADGSVSFDGKNIRDFKGLSGGFDVTDLIMKGKGEDPYRYEKQKFLKATAEVRAKMAARQRQERLRSALFTLPEHLERIWRSQLSARERRRLLVALWKEAAISDKELGAAASEARITIEAFVRARLPEGSTDAFTEEELARVNRNATERFEPYR